VLVLVLTIVPGVDDGPLCVTVYVWSKFDGNTSAERARELLQTGELNKLWPKFDRCEWLCL
jgi:hypothetical protein